MPLILIYWIADTYGSEGDRTDCSASTTATIPTHTCVHRGAGCGHLLGPDHGSPPR